MNNLDIRPSPGQALGDKAAVTALRGGLAAEETANALREQVPIEGIRDTSRVHQRLEARDIPLPVMVLAIVIKNLGRRRQVREMEVTCAVQAIQEPGEIVLLSEP